MQLKNCHPICRFSLGILPDVIILRSYVGKGADENNLNKRKNANEWCIRSTSLVFVKDIVIMSFEAIITGVSKNEYNILFSISRYVDKMCIY